MNAILKELIELSDAELYSLSDAIDAELDRRSESNDDFADSARAAPWSASRAIADASVPPRRR